LAFLALSPFRKASSSAVLQQMNHRIIERRFRGYRPATADAVQKNSHSRAVVNRRDRPVAFSLRDEAIWHLLILGSAYETGLNARQSQAFWTAAGLRRFFDARKQTRKSVPPEFAHRPRQGSQSCARRHCQH